MQMTQVVTFLLIAGRIKQNYFKRRSLYWKIGLKNSEYISVLRKLKVRAGFTRIQNIIPVFEYGRTKIQIVKQVEITRRLLQRLRQKHQEHKNMMSITIMSL